MSERIPAARAGSTPLQAAEQAENRVFRRSDPPVKKESPFLQDITLARARALVRAMEAKRQRRLPLWRKIQRHILPARGHFGEETASSAADMAARRLSSAGTRAARTTAAGMTSSITPQNMRWFRLDPRDKQMLERPYVRQWLDDCESVMRTTLSAGQFYAAIHNFNLDFSGFGCSLLFADHDEKSVLRFECCTIGSWAVSLDSARALDAVCRRLRLTASEVLRLYPKTASERVSTLCQQPDTALQEVEIVHLVTRNERLTSGPPLKLGKKERPWRHLVWEEGEGKQFLHEGGYYEMPYMFAVWDDSHDIYGSGPGDDALGDVAQAQELKRLNLLSAQMRVTPPMLAPAQYQGRLALTPGAINKYALGEPEGIRPLLQGVSYDSAESRAELAATESDIRDALMASIFATLPMEQRPPGMTATEFLARKQERLLLLGPAISRYMTQLSDLLMRVWCACDRALQLPPPPPSVTEQGVLDVVYTSPMSQALQQSGVESTQAVVEMVLRLAQADPTALDKLNIDQVIDVVAVALGAPGSVVRSDDEVAHLRGERAKAQAEALQMQQMREMVDTVAKVGAVPTQGTLAGTLAGTGAGTAGPADAEGGNPASPPDQGASA